MRKFFIFLCCFCILTVSVFADDVITDSAIEILSPEPSTTVVVDNTGVGDALDRLTSILSGAAINQPSGDLLITDSPVQVVETPSLYDVTVTVQRISASDATGFKAVVLTLLGDYEAIVTDYEYRNNNNTYMSHSIEITEDWTWISSAAIFLVVIFCFFRLVGGMLCKR